MADLQDEIDSYYDKYDLEKIDQNYKNNLGPTLSQLRKYSRPGENQISQVMLNRALSSEAAGTRAANEASQRSSIAAFGDNPTGLNSSLAFQQNLASQRPAVQASVEAARPQVAANIGNAIGNTMMVKPALRNAHLAPYFANEAAIATQEQIDVSKASLAVPEAPGMGSQILGAILSLL